MHVEKYLVVFLYTILPILYGYYTSKCTCSGRFAKERNHRVLGYEILNQNVINVCELNLGSREITERTLSFIITSLTKLLTKADVSEIIVDSIDNWYSVSI